MSEFIHLSTISDLFKLFQFENAVRHPLVAVVDFTKVYDHISDAMKISADFYSVMFKRYRNANIRYGRRAFDFQNGSLICMAPNQVIEMSSDEEASPDMNGWGLFFHPDLTRAISLHHYSFFSYEITEALHLSENEIQTLHDCIQKIEAELQQNIDTHSQTIIVSNIELFLNYCSRFYGRQFITRKSSNNFVVAQIEKILTDYFDGEQGLPTVKYLAEQVNLSPGKTPVEFRNMN